MCDTSVIPVLPPSSPVAARARTASHGAPPASRGLLRRFEQRVGQMLVDAVVRLGRGVRDLPQLLQELAQLVPLLGPVPGEVAEGVRQFTGADEAVEGV